MGIEDGSVDDRIVVIVEDDSTLAFIFQMVMKESGISAAVFHTAEDALEAVKRCSHSVRLVLSDIDLPGEVSGVELSSMLECEFPRIPVILMSGRPGVAGDAKRRFLQKPIEMNELIDAVRSCG